MNADYEELVDAEDEEEQLKRRLEMKKERSKAILSNQIKSSGHYRREHLRCFTKLSFDFRTFVNYVYSDNQTGVYLLFLFVCFIFFFSTVSVAVVNLQFMFLLVPAFVLFVYHFVQEARTVNLYGAAFFFIQAFLEILLIFMPNHGIIIGIVSLIFTGIHLVVKANIYSLRFYLKVSLIYGLGYIGVGMKQIERYAFNNMFLLYYLIFLALVWIILNKFTLLQLIFIWIPQGFKLFFKRTRCKPRPRFDYREIYKFGDRFIVKGYLTRIAFSHILLVYCSMGSHVGCISGRS